MGTLGSTLLGSVDKETLKAGKIFDTTSSFN